MKHSIYLLAKMLLISLVVFAIIRLCYVIQYPEYFHDLALSKIIESLVYGIRYDASITVLLIAIFAIILLLPCKLTQHHRLRQVLAWLSFVVLVMAWAMNLVMLAYFGEVFRHAGKEALAATNEFKSFLSFAVGPFWYLTVFGVLGIAVMGWIWQKWIISAIPKIPVQKKWHIETTLSLAAVVILVLFARGFMLSGKSIGTIDAFKLGNEKAATLSINGTFNLFQTIRKANNQPIFKRFSDEEQAKHLKQQAFTNGDAYIRVLPKQNQVGKNVVLIAVESLNFDAIDGLTGQKRGLTPFMDSLLLKSRYYTNFYSSGQRSIEGIQSILTSVPLLDDQPFLGFGLENSAISRLPQNLTQQQYQTTMTQASPRRSFYMDGIANSMGFEHYYGREDYPLLRQYPNPPAWGWDYEAFMYLFQQLKTEQQTKPGAFFTFTFTASTHSPFKDPGKAFHVVPHVINDMAGYHNTVRYFDWSLEQFMTAAAKEPWYQNTVFIITADHVLRASTDGDNWQESFHIPLIIYSPDGSIVAGKDERIASHYDIMPTVADLAAKPMHIAAFGYSLLSEDKPFNGALVKKADTYAWISDKGWFSFNAKNNVHMSDYYRHHPADLQNEQDYVFARLQGVQERLDQNKWFISSAYH